MALEFPDNFPFNRKPDAAEPTAADPALVAEAPAEQAIAPVTMTAATPSPVSAMEPVAVTTTATIAADVIAQSVAQAVVQAVNAQPAAAAAAAMPAAPAIAAAPVVAAAEPIAPTVTAAQDAAMSRVDGGPPPGMKERRRVPRQTLVAKTTVRSEAQLTVVAQGFVSNISMMGVGFHTRKPLAVGEKYQIRLEVGPMKWASRLRVITCRQNGDTYDVGAEFVGNELASLSRRELAA